MYPTEYIPYVEESYATPQAQEAARQRKQRQTLDALVRRVIRNEMTEQEQLLVRLYWYRGKSKEEIAALTGLHRKAVERRLEHCRKILYDSLKYTVEFHFSQPESQRMQETMRSAGQNTFAIAALDGVGERLTACLRQRRLNPRDVTQATGIEPARLRALEQDGRQMNMIELSRLCNYLQISVNSLLFGETEREYPH